MTLFRKGQKIKLTSKPNAKFSGEVVGILKADYNNGPGHLSVFELEDALTTFNGNAWDVEVVNELPTEPGFYIGSKMHDTPNFARVFTLSRDGIWAVYGEDRDAEVSAHWAKSALENGGLTRLVPES